LIDIYSEIREKVSFLLNEIDGTANILLNDNIHYRRNRNIKDIYRLLRSIANALGRSHRGIKNLITTYDKDSNIEARLESIMDVDIKDVYADISKALPEEYKPEIFLFTNSHLTFSKYYHINEDDDIETQIDKS